MKTLQQILTERDTLKKERTEAVQAHLKKIVAIDKAITEMDRLEKLSLSGLNIQKIQMAEKIIYCSGDVDKLVDGRILTEVAALDIAKGHPHLKTMYFGNKRYDGFYQSSDHAYGYGPKHGSIVDRISMKDESRGQVLCEEEIEACIYYLKNYSKIKTARLFTA